MKKKATGNQEHKPEGTPITYPDAPPAFGPHYPVTAPFERKFYTTSDRPQIEYVVHNLEHGYTLLWYDDDDRQELRPARRWSRPSPRSSQGPKLTDKFIALPWTLEGRQVLPVAAPTSR